MASSFEGLFNSSFLKISPPMQQQQEAQEGSTPTGPATAPATTPEPSHQRDHHRDYRANAVQPSGKKTSSHCSFCWDVLSLELKHASSQCRKRQKYCFYCRIGGHSDANCTRQNKDSECGFCRDILGAKRTHSAANCPRIKNYCFHCRKNGHCDATCGLQRLCEVCWKMGHATKNCRYASGSNNASSTSEESSRRQTEVIDSGMTNNPWDHSSSSSSLEMVC